MLRCREALSQNTFRETERVPNPRLQRLIKNIYKGDEAGGVLLEYNGF